MPSIINLLILIFWFISAAVDYGEFCYLWQLKEYRWDRFRDFLSTREGKVYWAKYSFFWRSLAALLIFAWPINTTVALKYVILIFFISDVSIQTLRFLKRRVRFPAKTFRAFILVVLSIFFEGGLFLLTRDWALLFLLIIIRFVVISLFVKISCYPTVALKNFIIKQATRKISKYNKLITIGVTGSFGKTTVKEFLNHLLSAQFSVIKTPSHVNTDIGVAKFILKQNFDSADIFVVEMGAYRSGEIKKICQMVSPKIGIITAISEQHLSLFGSIENIQNTKYELLLSLPKEGLAVINRDSGYIERLVPKIKAQIRTYGVDEELKPNALLQEIKSTPDGIFMKTVIDGQVGTKTVPITGEHLAKNLGACVLVAIYLKMDQEKYLEKIKTLYNPDSTLKKYKFGKSIILDDSYNSNPDGFMAALGTLFDFPPDYKRVVITRGMYELGGRSSELHQKIGGAIAYSADELIIVSKDFEFSLRQGVGKKFQTTIKTITEPDELFYYVKSLKDSVNLILLQNRLLPGVYKKIMDMTEEIK